MEEQIASRKPAKIGDASLRLQQDTLAGDFGSASSEWYVPYQEEIISSWNRRNHSRVFPLGGGGEEIRSTKEPV